MPLLIATEAPTLLIRKEAFERVGLTRAQIDEWLKSVVLNPVGR